MLTLNGAIKVLRAHLGSLLMTYLIVLLAPCNRCRDPLWKVPARGWPTRVSTCRPRCCSHMVSPPTSNCDCGGRPWLRLTWLSEGASCINQGLAKGRSGPVALKAASRCSLLAFYYVTGCKSLGEVGEADSEASVMVN